MSEGMSVPHHTDQVNNGGTLLVPVDGSAESIEGLEYAAALPVRSIVLLRVVPGSSRRPDSASNDDPLWGSTYGQQIRDDLEALASQYTTPDRPVTALLRYGDAAAEIISEAEQYNLVVMSTHGEGAVERVIFGSVADRVVRHGSTPTLLIRSGQSKVAPVDASRIVVPLDGSARSEYALPVAERLSAILSIPIHLVRIVSFEDVTEALRTSPADYVSKSEEDDQYERARMATERAAADYLDGIATRLGVRDITTEVLGGSPGYALLWALTKEDIVVLTSRGMGGVQRWLLGSVAEKLVREAPSPVLLVPVANSIT